MIERLRRTLSGSRWLLELLASVVGATAVIFALSAVALMLYTNDVAAPTVVEVTVPSGAAGEISQGSNVLDIPPVWTFNAGDTLVISNDDVVSHTLGEWSVAPGGTEVIDMDVTVGGDFVTSLHPNGIVTVTVEPSSFDVSIIAATTLAFGVSVGVIIYAGVVIMRAMSKDEEDWEAAPDGDPMHPGPDDDTL